MATIGTLSIGVVANTSAFAKGMGKAADIAESFASRVLSVGSAVAPLAGLLGAGALASGLKSMVSGSLDAIDSASELASQLGTTTARLGELKYAVQLTGGATEVLDGALAKLNQNLGDAASGSGPAVEALKKLGLNAKDLISQDPADAFAAISGGIAKIPTAAERAAVAVDLFGRAGGSLLNTLSAGPERLAELAQRARDLGLSLSEADVTKVGLAKDAIDNATAAVEGLANRLTIELAPAITVAADRLAQMSKGGAGISSVAGVIGDTFEGIGLAAQGARGVVTLAAAQMSTGLAALGLVSRETAVDLNRLAAVRIAKVGEDLTAKSFSEQVANPQAAGLPEKPSRDPVAEGAAATALKVEILTAKLKEQADAFGLTGTALEIYRLKAGGATAEQLAEVTALHSRLDAME